MKTAKAGNKIKRWERSYPLPIVRYFVEDALKSGRSLPNKEVYRAWLNDHPVYAPTQGWYAAAMGPEDTEFIKDILRRFPLWPTTMREVYYPMNAQATPEEDAQDFKAFLQDPATTEVVGLTPEEIEAAGELGL